MKKITFLNLVLLIVLFPLITSGGATKYIDGFQSSTAGEFPKGWRTRPGQKGEAKKVYKIVEEGKNKYLAADDSQNISVQIFKLAHWDLDKYPILKWKWRARKLPSGANETVRAKNDSACGVYVSFGMVRGKALKYTWSTTAPNGTKYKKDDNMHILVKERGSPGRWVYEKTNVVEDAKATFGAVPDRTLSGLAILTDGNATGSAAACDYDNFAIEAAGE